MGVAFGRLRLWVYGPNISKCLAAFNPAQPPAIDQGTMVNRTGNHSWNSRRRAYLARHLRNSISVNSRGETIPFQGQSFSEYQLGPWSTKMENCCPWSADLKRQFPQMKGFSVRSLKCIWPLAEAWNADEIVQQVAAQLPPWFHNCASCSAGWADTGERVWYARAAIHHGSSRSVLVHQNESDLRTARDKLH